MRRLVLLFLLAVGVAALQPGAAQASGPLGSEASGDFSGDGREDLAVGVPFEDVGAGPVVDAGAVNVLYGTATGLSATGNQLWHQNSAGVLDVAEDSDHFSGAA
jgi:hypothetical protein